jgi:SAM-dependent methyltransferase
MTLYWDLAAKSSAALWERRWREKAEHLPYVDWPNFRRHAKLMDGLQDPHEYFDDQLQANQTDNVPFEYCEDSRIGNPEGEVIMGRFCTANSLRHGRYMHSINQRWIPKPGRSIRVVEIGGGYGGFALAFIHNIRANVEAYTLIDSSVCLDIQKYYLGQSSSFPFSYAYSRAALLESFDFVIAINCLGEMDADGIEVYFRFIQSGLTPGGVFYSNNMESSRHPFPYDSRWKFLADNNWTPSVRERLAIRLPEK